MVPGSETLNLNISQIEIVRTDGKAPSKKGSEEPKADVSSTTSLMCAFLRTPVVGSSDRGHDGERTPI